MSLSPSRTITPQNQATDIFSGLLTGGGQPIPLTGNRLFDPLIAQLNAKNAAIRAGPLGQLATGNLPQWGGSFGVPTTGFENQLLSNATGSSTGILDALAHPQSLGGVPDAAFSNLAQLSGPAALGDVFQAMDKARQIGLGTDTANLREQFSSSGLRDSSSLATAIANLSGQSETQQQSQFGQLGLQNLATRTSAAGALGNLGLGQAGFNLSSMEAYPQVLQSLFGVGEQGRQVQNQALMNQIQEFARTQGGLLPLILQFLGGAPNIVSPGIGQQLLSAGTAVGAAYAGK